MTTSTYIWKLLVSVTEKAMAPHSSTLAWKIPWTEEPGRLQSVGLQSVRHDWVTSLSCIGEGNGSPLQCSCLENPRDGGAWWAAVYGVTQSWTRLKWLSNSSSSSSICKRHLFLCLSVCAITLAWDGRKTSGADGPVNSSVLNWTLQALNLFFLHRC